MHSIAKLVSTVLHPLIMPLLCVLVAGEFDWYVRGTVAQEQLRITYLIVAVSTIAFPGVNILLLRWYGALTSLEVPERKERFAPLISSIFFFVLGYILLRRGALPLPIYAIVVGCIASLLLLLVFNFRFKMSAHAMGVSGLLGVTVALFRLHGWSNLPLMMGIVLMCGLVLSARLVLKVHTPREVYLGAVFGFTMLYLSVSRLWFI